MREDYKVYEGLEPEDLLEELGISAPPFDPYLVAKKLNIEVGEELDWSKLSYDGEIYIDENKNTRIWINRTNHKNRKVFTVAHEIGHFINDVIPNYEIFEPIFDDKESLSFKRDGNKNYVEYRANDFAARLLMPKQHVFVEGKKIIDRFLANYKTKIPKEQLIKELAKVFSVSDDAMKWRLKNLNMIS